MRYLVRVEVPGTKGLDYELDRLSGYTGSFAEAEELDVLSQLDTLCPLVLQVRDLKNSSLPGGNSNTEARITVRALYDSQDAIVDTITFMPDSSLKLVPIDAIDAAPLTDAQKTTAYERLARLEVDSLPQEIQDVLPNVVGSP